MPSVPSELRQNVWKVYVLSALSNFGFSVPIVILFQQSLGFSLEQAFTIQAFYSMTLVCFEIPSGYLSDRWGRKKTIISGSVALFLGMILYCLGSTFSAFLAAEFFLAIGMSLHSGTLEAITYDPPLELKEEKHSRRISGHQAFISLASRSGIALLVGVIAAVNLRAPFWADLILFGAGLLVALLLKEPSRHQLKATGHLHAMWNIFSFALIRSALLRSLIILYTVVAAINLMIFWFLQPYQNAVSLPLPYFGVLSALIFIASAVASKYTYLVKRWLSDRLFLLLLSLIAVLCCVVLGFTLTLWGLALFFIGETTFNAFETLTGDLINKATTSDMRATILSLRSFTSRLFFALISPLLGYFADAFSLNQAILLSGLIGLAGLGVTFLFTFPVWERLPHGHRHK